MMHSRERKSGSVATQPDEKFPIDPSDLTVGDMVTLQWIDPRFEDLHGRVLATYADGARIAPYDAAGVRMCQQARNVSDDDAYVTEVNGDPLF